MTTSGHSGKPGALSENKEGPGLAGLAGELQELRSSGQMALASRQPAAGRDTGL